MRLQVAVLLVVALLAPGCFGSSIDVRFTAFAEGEDAWNRHNQFRVLTPEDANVSIEIRATNLEDGTVRLAEGEGDVTLVIPDGTWKIRYDVDGKKRGTLSPVRIDTTAPQVVGLELVGIASTGTYNLGEDAIVEPGATVEVVDLQTGQRIASSLAIQVSGLGDGIFAYAVRLQDPAGNWNNQTVQVRSGTSVLLPSGQWTYGVVARYTNRVQLWDLRDPEAYLDRSTAGAQAGTAYLGDGYGITPDDPDVRAVADSVVTSGMGTMEAAIALYRWMVDNLEYDESRLDSRNLMMPAQTLFDREDPGEDESDEGLARDGGGNGVRGGVCRDLAGAYVSLLRAAGVPARLVSGYVGGSVDGFHAWVEFYAGPAFGQDPWVPVDVSPIDGAYLEERLLQSFGILHPDYLPLRVVEPEDEVAGWSTAMSVRYSYPRGEEEPTFGFEKHVTPTPGFEELGFLCFNPETRARKLDTSDARSQDHPEECPLGTYSQYFERFLWRTERTIDYGIQVESAPAGTEIHGEVAYPFEEGSLPNEVVFQFYGAGFPAGFQNGKAVVDDTV
ncbi:MAG TPA: transglutaminase-like domain-containing protein [Candidatus Thermoplasmatota archaeon]|nr:transglutaminase-like domain-containing protein [Candidatus Thermoplasmatota archaeon]